jgi:hypothetical protein
MLLYLERKKGYLSNNAYLITVLEKGTEKVSGNYVLENFCAIQDVNCLWRLFYSRKCTVKHLLFERTNIYGSKIRQCVT